MCILYLLEKKLCLSILPIEDHECELLHLYYIRNFTIILSFSLAISVTLIINNLLGG